MATSEADMARQVAQIEEDEQRGREMAYDEALGAALEQEMAGVQTADLDAVADSAPDEDAPEAQPMSDDELKALIEDELEQAHSYLSDEVDQARAKALDYYHARPRGDERPGRSKVISTDVADMVDAMMAQIIPGFTQDLAVQFGAESEGDEERVQEESDYCNWVVQEQNDGYTLFSTAFKEALLLANCVAEVLVDQEESVETRQFDGMPPIVLAQLPAQGWRIEGVTQRQDGLVDVAAKRITARPRVRIEAFPVDDFVVNADHNKVSVWEARFCARMQVVTASDLIAEGVPAEEVEQMSTHNGLVRETQLSRARSGQELNGATETAHAPNRPILRTCCYMRVDYDGDGIAELRRVVRAGDVIIENSEASYVPFAVGAPLMMPHEWMGISLYDKLRQTQDSKTDFHRQAHDNARGSNNSRLLYGPGAREADVLNGGPNRPIKCRNPGADVVPLGVNDVLPSLLALLQYEDQVRTDRAGAALEMQSMQIPVGGDTAHGQERAASAREILTQHFSANLARTFGREVYLLVHRIVRENFQGPQQFKSGQRWGQTDPATWPERNRVTLTIGASLGERMRQAQALSAIISAQKEAMAAGLGGVLVDHGKLHNALSDYARIAGLENPERYWLDPDTPQAQQAIQRQAQQQQAQQQAAMERENAMLRMQWQLAQMTEATKRMQAQLRAAIDQAKIAEDRRQHVEDTATKLTEIELDQQHDVPGARV